MNVANLEIYLDQKLFSLKTCGPLNNLILCNFIVKFLHKYFLLILLFSSLNSLNI